MDCGKEKEGEITLFIIRALPTVASWPGQLLPNVDLMTPGKFFQGTEKTAWRGYKEET